MSASIALLAFALTATGVVLLRLSWGRRQDSTPAERAPRIVAGWSALTCAVPVWIAAAGPGRGVAASLLTIALLGLAVIARDVITGTAARSRPRRAGASDAVRDAPRARRAAHEAPRDRLLRGVGIFMLAGPVAAAAAYLLAVPLYAALAAAGVSGPDRIAVLVFFVPVAWAALAVAATVDTSLPRRAGWVAGTAVVAVLGAYVAGG